MFIKWRFKPCSLVLLLTLFSFHSTAQATEPDYTELSLKQLMSLEIFTAASMLPTELKKAPGTVYSFNREDFVRLGVRRINELLEYVPGFQLNQYRKRHRSIWSRGVIDRYNNKMKMLVDGVPVQHNYYGHFSGGENLALEKVDKIEVIIGPSSALYGANAFAGVIAITTRPFTDNSEQAYLETGLEVGDNSRAKGTVFYNSEKIQGFASYLDQDAPFRKDRKSFTGSEVSQPRDEEYKNIYLKAQPLKGLQISFDYQKNDTPFVFVPDNSHINTEEEFYNLSARYESGDLEQGKLETIAYYIDDQATEEEHEQITGQKAYKEHRDAIYYGIKSTWFKNITPAHTLAIGGEWQHDEARNMDFVRSWHYSTGFISPAKEGSLLSNVNEENNDYALFVQDVWALNDELTMTLGARYDDFERFDNDFNYRLALIYTLTEQQTLKMLWGTSVRKPTYREYLKVLENTTFKAPRPDTEKMETFELGYAYQWQNANVSMTAFYNEFDDYLHETPTPDGNDEYFINSDNTWRMHGVEILSEYQVSKKLSFRATAAWLEAREHGMGDIPYLAQWTASLFSDYQWYKSHHVALSVFYNSDREDTNDNKFTDDEPDSFVTLNAHAHGKIFDKLSYQVGVRNLTDEKIYDPAGDFDDRYNTQRTEREVWGKLTYTYRF